MGLLGFGGQFRLRQLLRPARVCTMMAEETVRVNGRGTAKSGVERILAVWLAGNRECQGFTDAC